MNEYEAPTVYPAQTEVPFDLSQLGITLDTNGRAHDATNGHFMKLNRGNVAILQDRQEFIIENLPGNVIYPEVTKAELEAEVAADLEPFSLRQRMVGMFRKARTELQLLPQTLPKLASEGLASIAAKSKESRRFKILGTLAGATALVAYMAEPVMATKYGVSVGGDARREVLRHFNIHHHLGTTATGHSAHQEVMQHFKIDNGPNAVSEKGVSGRHIVLSHFNVNDVANGNDGSVVKGYSARQDVLSHFQIQPNNVNPDQGTVGYNRHVYVDPGNGVTQELQQRHDSVGIDMTPKDYKAEYNYIETRHGDHILVEDPMYLMDNGEFGITQPGPDMWAKGVLHDDHRWLEMNGFLDKKKSTK